MVLQSLQAARAAICQVHTKVVCTKHILSYVLWWSHQGGRRNVWHSTWFTGVFRQPSRCNNKTLDEALRRTAAGICQISKKSGPMKVLHHIFRPGVWHLLHLYCSNIFSLLDWPLLSVQKLSMTFKRSYLRHVGSEASFLLQVSMSKRNMTSRRSSLACMSSEI